MLWAVAVKTPCRLYEDYRIPETYLNNDAMLKTLKPDAAVVAVSAANVCDVALTCIKQDVPTLFEKPPGLTATETEHLLKGIPKHEWIVHGRVEQTLLQRHKER